MERSCAELCHKPELPSRGTAVLCRVVCRQDLNFLDCVHIQSAQYRTGRVRASGNRPIHGDNIFVCPATIYVEAAITDTIRIEGTDTLAAHHTWSEGRQINRISPVESQILNLFILGQPVSDSRLSGFMSVLCLEG